MGDAIGNGAFELVPALIQSAAVFRDVRSVFPARSYFQSVWRGKAAGSINKFSTLVFIFIATGWKKRKLTTKKKKGKKSNERGKNKGRLPSRPFVRLSSESDRQLASAWNSVYQWKIGKVVKEREKERDRQLKKPSEWKRREVYKSLKRPTGVFHHLCRVVSK